MRRFSFIYPRQELQATVIMSVSDMTNTLTNHDNSCSSARLERKLGKINMVAMTFAILKYAEHGPICQTNKYKC